MQLNRQAILKILYFSQPGRQEHTASEYMQPSPRHSGRQLRATCQPAFESQRCAHASWGACDGLPPAHQTLLPLHVLSGDSFEAV